MDTRQSRVVFKNLFILIAFALLTLPFWLTFQDILTKIVMNIKWYQFLQDKIVPHELSVIAVVLNLLHIPIRVGLGYFEWSAKDGTPIMVNLAWNCVGWQTFVLFMLSLLTGLSTNIAWDKKIAVFVIALLTTYLINILRLVLVVAVYFYFGSSFGVVFHNYFSNLLSLVWFFLFWWFAYRYVLEER